MATVDSVQNTALSFANTNAQQMDNFAQQAMTFAWEPISWFANWTSPGYVPGYNGGQIAAPAAISLPTVSGSVPVTPTLPTITLPSLDNPPDFLVAEPIVNIPVPPSSLLPSAPGSPPSFNSPTIPTAPIFTLPDTPSFQNVITPDMPLVEYPTFSSELPVMDITAPTNTFMYVEPTYESDMLDELKAKIMRDLLNGGYGIDDADEMRLWQRAREREAVAAEVAIQDTVRQAAARGFTMPTGALNAMVAAAQTAALEKNSSVSRDIMVKKADLYVENRKFTMTQAKEVEQMMITMFGYMAERLLRAAKETVELGIAVFNVQVARHNARLETYKAAASVYAELIRGASLKLEAYKTAVEGARLTVDVQRIHAEVYRMQMEGINALINVYATQMQASKVAAEVEQIKLDAFKLQVETYVAQVGAKTAEFSMFESQIKGEMAKVSTYQVQAQAYASKVGAYKSKADAAEVLVRAQATAGNLKLEAYKTDVMRYQSELQRSQYELTAAVSRYEADIKKYSVTVDAAIRSSQQNVEAGKANADVAVAHAQVIASSVVHSASIIASKATASANTMASVAGAYGSASAAAMSAATGIIASIS